MDRIVGIDLGTSTSCLAAIVDGEPVVAPDSRGNRVTPSYIHVMEDGKILVGPQAKAEVISDPYSTIWATKRLIGRRYDDPGVQESKKYYGYDILRAADGGVKVKGRDKELSPTEVAAIILKYLTRIGKKVLGEDIKRAVITVPAYFTDPQRKATREAGTMIGLDVVRLVNEPTAAALAYGYDQDMEQTVAIFDLGGGTFDLSILAIGQGVFEVVATDGDSFLGGEDFDNRLVDFLVKDFKKKFAIDIYNDKMAHQRVKDAAERSKIALSDKEEIEINLPAICPDLNRWAGVEATVTRKQYETMVDDLVSRTTTVFQRVLKEVGMGPRDLDNVIMVGGMTRMPLVRRKVTEFLGYPPDLSLNPDEAVAVGAAIHAASLSGEKLRRKPRLVKAAAPAFPPQDATLPGFYPDAEKTRPGIAPSPELTRPGVPQEGLAEEELAPPELPAPPPPAPIQTAPDFSHEPLPMDKRDADLPIDPERLPPTESAPPAAEPAPSVGEEWEDEGPQVPEPAPEVETAEPSPPLPETAAAEPVASASPPDEAGPALTAPEPPAAFSRAPAFQPPAGDDEFFFPPPATVAEPEPVPAAGPELAAAAPEAETLEAIPPEEEPIEEAAAEKIFAEPETLAAPPESPPPFDQGLPPEPQETEEPTPLAAAEADEEAASFTVPIRTGPLRKSPSPETEVTETTAPIVAEPAPPAGDDHPVSVGPLIKDYTVREPPPREPKRPSPAARPVAPSVPAAAPEFIEAPVLLDVLSQTVGIAHFGGHFVPIIKRFAKLPARASQVFTTCKDNQERIRITVLQGEGRYIKQNTPLGEFVLTGIEQAKRGRPEIEITFDIDQSGIFMVSAKDKNTGAVREIKLSNWTGGVAAGSGNKSGESEDPALSREK